jgi:(p)ppGpp synthase/HD superfamily hydrolase
MVVTGKARSAIRRATKAAIRRQYAGLGRQILERAFGREKRPFDDALLTAALPRLAQSNVEDALAAVGRGEIRSADVIRAVYPDHAESQITRKKARNDEGGWFGLKRGSGMKFRVPGLYRRPQTRPGENAIPIRGLDQEMAVRFAESGAVPGERIVGIMTPGEGITVYPIQSPALKAFDEEPERWLDVTWDVDENDKSTRFPARIEVTAINEPGALVQVATVIADNDGNISNIKITQSAPDFSVILIDVEVFDIKHLNRLIAQLKTRPVVNKVQRVSG